MLAKIKYREEGELLRVVKSILYVDHFVDRPNDSFGKRVGGLSISPRFYTAIDGSSMWLWIGNKVSCSRVGVLLSKINFNHWLSNVCPVKVKKTFNKKTKLITLYVGIGDNGK